MSSLIATLRSNSNQIAVKLTELRQLLTKLPTSSSSALASKSNSEMDSAALVQRLKQENDQLKQQIADCTKQLADLDARRSELIPAKKEQYPLPVPKVLKTSEVKTSTDALEAGGDSISSTETKKSAPAKKVNAKESKAKKEKAPVEPVNEKIDASRLKFLIGKIVDVQRHPDAEKLYVEQIELGEDKPRTIISGLVDYVPIEEMRNRLVVVLANLKPVKMRGILSEGMVMCASNKDANQVQPLLVPEGAQPGDRIEFAQYPGQPDDLLNPKKKIFEQVSPDLVTDANGVATYKGDPFVVPGKGVASVPGMPNVPVR